MLGVSTLEARVEAQGGIMASTRQAILASTVYDPAHTPPNRPQALSPLRAEASLLPPSGTVGDRTDDRALPPPSTGVPGLSRRKDGGGISRPGVGGEALPEVRGASRAYF